LLKPLRSQTEKAIIFPGGNNRELFGVVHYPEGISIKTGILYCHPFAEEKNLSHRISVNFARNVSSKGYPVMRFDLSGCGDSEGELNEFTIDDWLMDLFSAERYFRNLLDLENCVLWGLRLGGYLSMHYAAMQSTISGLILWQPVKDPQAYLHQFLRQHLLSRLISGIPQHDNIASLIKQLHNDTLINVMGYPISRKLYESFIQNRAIDIEGFHNIPILVLSISILEEASSTIYSFLDDLNALSDNIIFEHINEEPFWNRPWRYHSPKTENATIDWIQNHY
jgi:exosortase A-associated hydrolase 2